MRTTILTVILFLMVFVFGLGRLDAEPVQTNMGTTPHANVQGSKKVQLYITSWCPYCRKMEEFLIASKIPYRKLDVENNETAAKDFRRLQGDGVPFIVVDRTLISGYDPEAVRSAWDDWNKE